MDSLKPPDLKLGNHVNPFDKNLYLKSIPENLENDDQSSEKDSRRQRILSREYLRRENTDQSHPLK